MNWKSIATAALLCMGCLMGLSQPKMALDVEVRGLPDGYCRILGMLGGQNYVVDSVRATNGKFHLERAALLPTGLYYVVFPDERTFFQFLLDTDQTVRFQSDVQDLVKFMKVEGCIDNELLYSNLRYEATFKQRFDSVEAAIASAGGGPNVAGLQQRKTQLLEDRKAHVASFAQQYPGSFFTRFKSAGQNPELQNPRKPDGSLDTLRQLALYRDAYFANTPLNDEGLLRTPVVPNKLKTYMTQLTPQAPDSVIKYADRVIAMARGCDECYKFVVNWIAIQYEKPTIMGGEVILVHLVDKYFTDDVAARWFPGKPEELAKIRKKVNEMRPSLLGKTGQDLRAKNPLGEYESLYELKSPIKVVFMYSASCSHCQERAPVLRDLLAKWKGKVEVYALCLDPDEAKWREFIDKYQLQGFHNVIDPKMESRYYYKYHVDITPECYVLDPANVIVAKDLHPNQLEPVFEKVMAGLK